MTLRTMSKTTFTNRPDQSFYLLPMRTKGDQHRRFCTLKSVFHNDACRSAQVYPDIQIEAGFLKQGNLRDLGGPTIPVSAMP